MTDNDNGAKLDAASGTGTGIDPIELARRDLKRNLARRFYDTVSTEAVPGGFSVALDGRPIRTPAKQPLVLPTRPLAEAVAAEWRDVGDLIEPDRMALTRLVNTAIDGVSTVREGTAAEVAKYAETDLLCYRAGDPSSLVREQARQWDPVLAFFRDRLHAPFTSTVGISFTAQDPESLSVVRHLVAAAAEGSAGDYRLASLSLMTSLTGSVLLALAVVHGRLTAEEAWAAAHVDEDFQIAQWGADAEAFERRERRWRDMKAAADLLRLVGTDLVPSD